MPRIVIVDDERPLRAAIARFVRTLAMESEAVASGEEALGRIRTCDVLITDVRMPVTKPFDLNPRVCAPAMIRTGGNKNRAAALLKLNRTTLVEKIKRYALAS